MSEDGLKDVVACHSSICFIDGEKGRLLYRGYDIRDLIKYSTYEETAYLLLYGKLPNHYELGIFSRRLADERHLEKSIENLIKESADFGQAMTALRTAVSASAMFDRNCGTTDQTLRLKSQAMRLIGQLPVIVARFYNHKKGAEMIRPGPNVSHAEALFTMLKGREPSDYERKIFDECLILHAEHELNASTFAARVVSSTDADMYAAMTGAIGALSGPRHGGANEQVALMMQAAEDETGIARIIAQLLTQKKKIPGFGHRVYQQTTDPRALILKDRAKELAEKTGRMDFYRMFETAEQIVYEQKNLRPNVDFYSACVYRCLEIPTELFTPMFAISRAAGWSAHVLEQCRDDKNKIMRPRAEYVGEAEQQYAPLHFRKN